MTIDVNLFLCPYVNKEKAELFNTQYFCDFDNMEFESMTAHCKNCEMYEQLIKNAMRIFEEQL